MFHFICRILNQYIQLKQVNFYKLYPAKVSQLKERMKIKYQYLDKWGLLQNTHQKVANQDLPCNLIRQQIARSPTEEKT